MLGEVHTNHRWTALVLVIAVAGLEPAPAAADAPPWELDAAQSEDVARAEAHAAEAFAAYERKDYTGAISLYMKALAASPSANILFNVARIYDTKIGDRELASKFYRRYIAEPGAEPDRVRMANERLLVLRQLDRAEQRSSGTANAPAQEPPKKRSPYPRRPEPEHHTGLSGLQIAGIVVASAGLAGLGVGTGFGLAAKSDADVVKELCVGNRCTSQRGVDETHDAREAAKIATISFIAGGALTVLGTGLLAWGLRVGGDHDDTATLTVAPFATTSAAGSVLTGRW